MANANLALLTTANTFMDWLITTNNEANSINELRNGNYYKDGGNFTVANGTIFVLNSAITSIQTSGNNILGQQTTMNTQITTSNATFQSNVLLTAATGYLQAANSVLSKYANVNTSVNVSGVIVLTGATANGNVTFVNTINNQPTLNIANNVLIANTGIAEWKNNVNFSNSSAVVNVAGTLNANNLLVLTANIPSINLDSAGNYTQSNGNLVINNLTVKGNQTIVGNSTLTSASLQLRTGISSDGDGFWEVYRGTTIAANATIKFNHTANVIQFAANDAQTYSTILLVSNIADSVSNSSTTSVASANIVEYIFNTAESAANTVATFANGTVVLANANLNFNNTASINVAASANGTTQSNVAFNINTTMNLVSLNVSANISNVGNLLVTQNTFTGNLAVTQNVSLGNLSVTQNINCAGIANIYQPTMVATRELLSNAATINSPNTAGLNTSLSSNFDITLGNTQFNSCNLTINSWAAPGNLQTIVVILRQPGPNGNTSQTSSNVVTWTNTSIKWSNGEVPVLSVFKGKADILTFTTVDGGNTVYGAHSMANCG